MWYLCTRISFPRKLRGVAQLASAPRSGRGGRKFESSHPDIINGCNYLIARPLFIFIKHFCHHAVLQMPLSVSRPPTTPIVRSAALPCDSSCHPPPRQGINSCLLGCLISVVAFFVIFILLPLVLSIAICSDRFSFDDLIRHATEQMDSDFEVAQSSSFKYNLYGTLSQDTAIHLSLDQPTPNNLGHLYISSATNEDFFPTLRSLGHHLHPGMYPSPSPTPPRNKNSNGAGSSNQSRRHCCYQGHRQTRRPRILRNATIAATPPAHPIIIHTHLPPLLLRHLPMP